MAKRVNTRFAFFLVGITVAVSAAGASLFLYQTKLNGGNSKKWAAEAKAAWEKGDAEKAASLYAAALSSDPDNTDLLLNLGVALERLTPKDRSNLAKAMTAWNKAVSVDPKFTPALERLLSVYTDQEQVNPHPELFVRVEEVCDKILAVRPDDRTASERKYVAIIDEWLNSQGSSKAEVREAVDKKIPELMKKYPDSGDLVKALAQAKAQQAKELLDTQEIPRAHLLLKEATEMVDNARKGKDDNESIQFRAFQAYAAVRRVDPDAEKKEKEYDQRMDASIEAARLVASKVKDPDGDPLCADVMRTAEDWLSRRGKPEKAEEYARAFHDANKNDPRARLDLARVLERKQFPRGTTPEDRAKAEADEAKNRKEALDLVSKEFVVREDIGGFKSLIQREVQARMLEEVVRLQLLEYASTDPSKEADKRKQVSAKMDKALADLRHVYTSTNVPEPEEVFDLEGQIHMVKGQDVEAVQSFQKAAGPINPNYEKYDILMRLADAYQRTGQPGLARQRLQQIITKQDKWAPPRIMLAKLAIQSNDAATARIQLTKLQEIAPESQEVKNLSAAFALMTVKDVEKAGGSTAVAEEVWKVMPEDDPNPEVAKKNRMNKARVALAIGKTDDAIRLYQDILKKEPGDTQATLNLAAVYTTLLGQKETAKRVLEDGLRAKPDDPSLVIAIGRLRGDSDEAIYTNAWNAVEKTADPFLREMQKFELESGPAGHPERAFGHLLAASNLKPDEVPVTDRVFNYYMTHGEYDKAEPLVERLGAQNADKCNGMMYRFRYLSGKQDSVGAEAVARELTQKYPEFGPSWLVLAQTLQARNDPEEARDAYLEVLKRQPQQYEAYLGLIDCFYKLNQPDQAKLRLEEARKFFPDDFRVREMLWNHYVNYGDAMLAVKEREKQLELDTRRQKDTADHYLSLAKAYFHAAQEVASNPDKASDKAKLLNKAFETLAKGKDKFTQEPRFYSQLAEMYQYNRDLKQGEIVLLEYFNRPEFKDDPQPSVLLYDFYLRANNLAMAEKYLNFALVRAEQKSDPQAVDLRLRLAALCAQEKKFDEAYKALDGVQPAAVRTSLPVVRQRIETQIAEGKRPEARKALESELTKHDSPDLGNLLASLMIDDRDLSGATRRLEHVLAIDPKNTAAIYLRSLATAQDGRINEAINDLLGLRNREPTNARVRLLLAELYEKSGNPQGAIRELDEGLKKQMLNKEVRENLIRLYFAQRPVTNDSMDAVIRLCQAAEADPVLGSDPEWPRQESEGWSRRSPVEKAAAIERFTVAIKLSGDDVEYRRQFIDMLLRFRDYGAVIVETDRLIKEGRNDWWLHLQRGVALAYLETDSQKPKALEEFDKALALSDKKTEPVKVEGIIRALGSTVNWKQALKRVEPLSAKVADDPDFHYRLLHASVLRAMLEFDAADKIVSVLLADPTCNTPERRVPLLRAKTDIWENRPTLDKKLPKSQVLACYIKARDAYVELLKYVPEDMNVLNNMAYLLAEQIPEPEGGAKKAKVYSEKAYDLARAQLQVPNVQVLDTHAWVLTLCGGEDALEGQHILEDIMNKRQDTKTFIEGRYHLGVAYLRAAKRNPEAAQKWLQDAMRLIGEQEKAGNPVDPILKDRVQSELANATQSVTTTN